MAEAVNLSRRRWLRFSLRSMIATTVILILGISHWNTSRELKSTRDKLAHLQRETGQLEIGDAAKLHVVMQHTTLLSNKGWQWRVYVPPGKSYFVSVEVDDQFQASKGGPAQLSIPARSPVVLKPGEWSITYEYKVQDRGEPDDHWSMALRATSTGSSNNTRHGLPLAHVPWLKGDWQRFDRPAGTAMTESFDAEETVDLFRLFAVPAQSWKGEEFAPESAKLKVRLTPIPYQP